MFLCSRFTDITQLLFSGAHGPMSDPVMGTVKSPGGESSPKLSQAAAAGLEEPGGNGIWAERRGEGIPQSRHPRKGIHLQAVPGYLAVVRPSQAWEG